MPCGTPVHNRALARATSLKFKEWAGYYAAERYGPCHELEYFAIRTRAAMIDVSPLYKYDLRGPRALAGLDRLLARDVTRLKDGQVAYACWCDERGKVIDDGTVFRFDSQHFRITSANPSYRWLAEGALGCPVEDLTERLGALAVQGPLSHEVLFRAGAAGIEGLGYFRHGSFELAGVPVTISRTGFTGDRGYEVWFEGRHGEALWDALVDAGATPCGLLGLDVARIEAGFVLIDVDFKSAHHALNPDQTSSPYEVGLGWTVQLDKASFVGQRALHREKLEGSPLQLVGLEVDMEQLEAFHDQVGIPCAVPSTAWRCHVPLYAPQRSRQVGYATSGTWSPLLKKYICLATVPTRLSAPGTRLRMETMVDTQRCQVDVRVVRRPFFDPPRKRA